MQKSQCLHEKLRLLKNNSVEYLAVQKLRRDSCTFEEFKGL